MLDMDQRGSETPCSVKKRLYMAILSGFMPGIDRGLFRMLPPFRPASLDARIDRIPVPRVRQSLIHRLAIK
jgi:hypothetical protein